MKYFGRLSKATIVPLLFLLMSSCGKTKTTDLPTTTPPPAAPDADLKSLPKDQGGVHTAVYLNSNISYGYYVYTPSSYSSSQADFPLLIFLHGVGEIGNSMTTPGELNRLLVHGPPQMIKQKRWSPTYPMIVISPQSTAGAFNATTLNTFITYCIGKYRINTHRIYMTGLSLGGFSTYNYISKYPNGYVAAAVPMSAAFDRQPDYSSLVNVPLWTFCGENDPALHALTNTTSTISKYNPAIKPKLTVFPGVGHDCWDLAYSGSGMGLESSSYDGFNISIYDWMFQYAK